MMILSSTLFDFELLSWYGITLCYANLGVHVCVCVLNLLNTLVCEIYNK